MVDPATPIDRLLDPSKGYEQVVAFLKYMDKGLAGTLSAFELLWKNTYQTMTSPPATERPPLPYDYRYYVLLESLGSTMPHRVQNGLKHLNPPTSNT